MDRGSTSYEELSMPFRAVCGIILALFSMLGLAGNINVLHVCRHQHLTLNQATRWILVNLAIFDLISCLVDLPAVFLVVVVKLSREELVHLLSVTTACVTFATVWGNCACLVLLALARKDATVRAFFPQRITIQRLRKLLMVTWLIYAFIPCCLFYFYHDVPFVLRRPKTVRRLIAKKIPVDLVVESLAILAVGYVLKCYHDIRNFLKSAQNDVAESHISMTQANTRRENEKKLTRVMLLVLIVFVISVLPLFVVQFFYQSVSAEGFIISKIVTLVPQITNPFIYSSINKDFVRFLCCFKCHCSKCTSSVSPLNPDEDILDQGVAPNGHDYPMRLEIVEDEIINSVSDVSGNIDRTREQQNCALSLTDKAFANKQQAPSGYYV